MEVARHWRLRGVRLGNPDAWRKIIANYAGYNLHLALGLLASDLSPEQLEEIHDRMVSGQRDLESRIVE